MNKNEDRKKDTELIPIPSEPPAEDQKLRHLTDDEIIQGFRYLINKDKKKTEITIPQRYDTSFIICISL